MAAVEGYAFDIVSGFSSGTRTLVPIHIGAAVDGYSIEAPCDCGPPCPPIPTPPPVVYVQTSGPKVQAASAALGAGIVRPFRRTEHQDFASDSGAAEVMSCVGQLLGTPIGSLPWRVDFGCGLEQLRHKARTGELLAFAHKLIDEALKRWEPRAQVADVSIDPKAAENALGLIITVRVGTQVKTLTL